MRGAERRRINLLAIAAAADTGQEVGSLQRKKTPHLAHF